jgi:hypothetical protein
VASWDDCSTFPSKRFGYRPFSSGLSFPQQKCGVPLSVSDPGCLSWSRIPDPILSIPDSGSSVNKILDPDPHQKLKYFYQKKSDNKVSKNKIRDAHPGSRILSLDFFRRGSGSATLELLYIECIFIIKIQIDRQIFTLVFFESCLSLSSD